MYFRNSVCCLLLGMLLSSCYYNKKLAYFQGEQFSKVGPTMNAPAPYRLKPHDVLSVKVKSATQTELSDIFNITPTAGYMTVDPGNLYMQGYSIDDAGEIQLPIIGALKVQGLTVDEARTAIQNRLEKEFLNKATSTVVVKLVSFKVTVLGEVKRPGYHYIYNDRLTLLEALGVAGDLTDFGNRQNVKLIREGEKGTETVSLDLTDPKILSSPYYHLEPNDVLYVEPLRARSKRSNLEVLSVIFAAATTAILILNYVNNTN